MLETVLK